MRNRFWGVLEYGLRSEDLRVRTNMESRVLSIRWYSVVCRRYWTVGWSRFDSL